MAVELYDAVNGDGLFQIHGKGFFAIKTLNTARLTTLPTEVKDFIAQYRLVTLDMDLERAIDSSGLRSAESRWQRTGETISQQIQKSCQNLLVELVRKDKAQPDSTLKRAMKYIIDQMVTAAQFVDANVVASSLVAASANVGDVAIAHTMKRGDGRSQENAYAEAIKLTVLTASATSPTVQFLGEAVAVNVLAETWPKGSGHSVTLTATDPARSLITNGDMELDSTTADVPNGWILSVGAPGVTVKVTDPEIQTVAITGSPTGGYYTLSWPGPDGVTRTTGRLAYNATAATVQTELRLLPSLAAVTVTATGTTPNYTHTVTFTGVAGNISELTSTQKFTGPTAVNEVQRITITGSPTGGTFTLTFDGQTTAGIAFNATAAATVAALEALSNIGTGNVSGTGGPFPGSTVDITFQGTLAATNVNQMTASGAGLTGGVSPTVTVTTVTGGVQAGTITHSTTTQGDDGAFRGRALVFDSDGAELSAINAPVTLEPETVYLLHFRIKRIGAAASGTVKAELIKSIGGTVLNDTQGVANDLSISASAISTATHDSQFVAFRTPKSFTNPLYVRLRISAAIPATAAIYFDDVALVKAKELYAGGPFAAAFIGKTVTVVGDNWTLTITNNRAGEIQEWYERVFGMNAMGLLLPSSGSSLIPDSVIA